MGVNSYTNINLCKNTGFLASKIARKNLFAGETQSKYLSISIVIKLLSHKGIKGIPVSVYNVTTDRPEITEDKGCTDENVQFVRVHVEVGSTTRE